MKQIVVTISTALCPLMLSSQLACALTPTPALTEVQKKLLQRPLMASDLSEKLIKGFHVQAPLSYGQGHSFYDAPVELVDDEGRKVTSKDQYNPQKHYELVSAGAAVQSTQDIWFFSPNGTNPEEINYDACTYENPCREITSEIVTYSHLSNSEKGKNYWFATGTYELPAVSQHTYHPQLIELKNEDSVSGRSFDFIHTPYEDDRPMLHGTLAWTDYHEHQGAQGSVNNIKMTASDNWMEVAGRTLNTNIYAGEILVVAYSDLYMTNKNKSYYFSGNLYAPLVVSFVTNLEMVGSNGLNIDSEVLYLDNVNATAKGFNVGNAYVGGNLSILGIGNMIQHSNFKVIKEGVNDEFFATQNTALNIKGSRLYLESVNIDVTSAVRDSEWEMIKGIRFVADSNSDYFFIANSKINVTSENAQAVGIDTNHSVILSNSSVTVEAANAQASGFINIPEIKFEDTPSLISVSSPVFAALFSAGQEEVNVINESNPASQCIINGATPQDC